MKKIKSKDAVAEIVGSVLLLSIAVSVFSVVYLDVLSDDGPSPETYVTLVGKLENKDDMINTVAFENRRGQILDPETEIIVQIGGDFGIRKSITLHQLSSYHSFLGNGWNIGEKIYPLLIFPDEFDDLTGVRVDANIVDKKSNSLVFWGRLQAGYEIPPFGRGGIWHLNESSWSGIEYDVKDSSGNINHGKAYGDANTVEYNVNGQTNRSGFFNYLENGNDFVVVPDKFSLDITNQITLEAWVNPLSFDSNIMAELENKFGYTPYIINRDNDIYIVVSEDQSKDGMVQTFTISSYGTVSEEPIDKTYFCYTNGQKNIRPIVYHIINDIYVIAYMGEDNHINLKTYNISQDGKYINYTGYSLTFNDSLHISTPNRPSIIKASEGVFAFAYRVSTNTGSLAGIMRVVNISDTGSFSDYEYNITFDDDGAYEPSFINIPGDAFAIAYRNGTNQGFIKRLKISHGNIEYIGTNLTFNSNEAYEPSIINVAGDVFAIAYRNQDDHGIIKRYKISKDYINPIGTSETFEASSCFKPILIKLYNQNYVVVYSEDDVGQPDGFYKSIEIADNGVITNIGPRETFDTTCLDPMAIRVTNRIFAVVYEGHIAHKGKLKTIHPEFTSDVYSSGICKYGSYGLFFNTTLVSGNINKITINASMPNYGLYHPWHHIALTYNRQQMILYIDGEPVASPLSLSNAIKITGSDLIFGEFFYGYIDEVAIYEKALTHVEIQNHFNNPGIFENEP